MTTATGLVSKSFLFGLVLCILSGCESKETQPIPQETKVSQTIDKFPNNISPKRSSPISDRTTTSVADESSKVLRQGA